MYQQNIDPNLQPFIATGDNRTNLEIMRGGNAPYIFKDDRLEVIVLHHPRQDGQGSLFELTRSSHSSATNQTGRKALHPYSPQKHPERPKDDKFFKKDQKQYWIERSKQFEE